MLVIFGDVILSVGILMEFLEKFVREAKCCSILFWRRVYLSLCQG